ncbi:MAG: rane protein [Herbinix sp.]|jgi:hypothetical protein|nr:rane protein [Herbinix sp.]
MKRKKLFAVLIMLVFILTACSKKDDTETTNTSKEDVDSETTEDVTEEPDDTTEAADTTDNEEAADTEDAAEETTEAADETADTPEETTDTASEAASDAASNATIVPANTSAIQDTDASAIVPDTFLGTDYTEATTGWEPDAPKVDTNLKDSAEIKIAGYIFDHGITTNSVGQFVYAVPEGAKKFVGIAGVDDVVLENTNDGGKASIDVTILFDGTETVKTDKLTPGQWAALNVDVPAGAKQITVIFGDAGDGITCDNAAMGNAGWITK